MGYIQITIKEMNRSWRISQQGHEAIVASVTECYRVYYTTLCCKGKKAKLYKASTRLSGDYPVLFFHAQVIAYMQVVHRNVHGGGGGGEDLASQTESLQGRVRDMEPMSSTIDDWSDCHKRLLGDYLAALKPLVMSLILETEHVPPHQVRSRRVEMTSNCASSVSLKKPPKPSLVLRYIFLERKQPLTYSASYFLYKQQSYFTSQSVVGLRANFATRDATEPIKHLLHRDGLRTGKRRYDENMALKPWK